MGTFLVCWETGTDLGGGCAAGLCTCHEFAFRRVLRWVAAPVCGRRSLLQGSIVAGLIVRTRHHPRRGRLRAWRGDVPGPQSSWQVHRPAAPLSSQVRSALTGKRACGPHGVGSAREERGHRGHHSSLSHSGHLSDLRSKGNVPRTVGSRRTAHVHAVRIACRDYGTSQGTKPAPARVMASAAGQSNHDRTM